MQRFCPICKKIKEITELQNQQYVQEQIDSGNPPQKISFRCEAGHLLLMELNDSSFTHKEFNCEECGVINNTKHNLQNNEHSTDGVVGNGKWKWYCYKCRHPNLIPED